MKDACQTLPHYTAVAHFAGNVLDTSQTNGDAGIFIGCGTDHFKVRNVNIQIFIGIHRGRCDIFANEKVSFQKGGKDVRNNSSFGTGRTS